MKKDEKVTKSNALIEAAYHPTSLYQMRLLLVAIAQIREGEKITHRTEFTISAQGMADLVGIAGKSGSHFAYLKQAADDLVDMSIRVTEYPDGRPRARRWWKINVVDSCGYIEDQAKVVLTFTPSIIPYITELEDRYKSYRLAHVIKMKSVYGMRLYELALRWKFEAELPQNKGIKEVAVGEFRYVMGLEDQYREMDDLKKRVIRPALRDVNEHTDLMVSFGQRKSGRSIAYFQFKIEKKPRTSAEGSRRATKRKNMLPSGTTTNGADFLCEGGDFMDYARRVLPRCKLGQRPWDEALKALRDEIETKGIYRDMKTGEIIQQPGQPVT